MVLCTVICLRRRRLLQNKCLRSVVVVNRVSRDARVDGVGPRHGNLDSPVVERLCEVGKRDIKPHDQVKQLEKEL